MGIGGVVGPVWTAGQSVAMIREQRASSDKTYLSSTSITDKHKLEGGNLLCGSVGHGC